MTAWYFVKDGERHGPIEHDALLEQLSSGSLSGDTLVWRDGMADWTYAHRVPELLPVSPGAQIVSAPGSQPPGGYDPFAADSYRQGYVTYAGFWKRFAAWVLDRVILVVAGGCFGVIIGVVMGALAGANDTNYRDPSFRVLVQIIGILLEWLYYAFFESSAFQATPGKMALRIKVTDESGSRISFARATGRYFGKILSWLTLLVGFMMAGFTERKQALHDMLAGCLVVNRQ